MNFVEYKARAQDYDKTYGLEHQLEITGKKVDELYDELKRLRKEFKKDVGSYTHLTIPKPEGGQKCLEANYKLTAYYMKLYRLEAYQMALNDKEDDFEKKIEEIEAGKEKLQILKGYHLIFNPTSLLTLEVDSIINKYESYFAQKFVERDFTRQGKGVFRGFVKLPNEEAIKAHKNYIKNIFKRMGDKGLEAEWVKLSVEEERINKTLKSRSKKIKLEKDQREQLEDVYDLLTFLKNNIVFEKGESVLGIQLPRFFDVVKKVIQKL